MEATIRTPEEIAQRLKVLRLSAAKSNTQIKILTGICTIEDYAVYPNEDDNEAIEIFIAAREAQEWLDGEIECDAF